MQSPGLRAAGLPQMTLRRGAGEEFRFQVDCGQGAGQSFGMSNDAAVALQQKHEIRQKLNQRIGGHRNEWSRNSAKERRIARLSVRVMNCRAFCVDAVPFRHRRIGSVLSGISSAAL